MKEGIYFDGFNESSQRMVVLVTGGSGFIGSHLVESLHHHGYDVRVFDKVRPSLEGVEWCKGDVTVKDSLKEAFRDVDQIYHLAAMADVNVVTKDPEGCVQANVVGTLNVLEASLNSGIDKLVLASTSWVYGSSSQEATEDAPLSQPSDVYVASKIMQEQLVLAWGKQFGLPYTILRYDIPYGPRMRPNMAIARFVSSLARKEPITVFGDGTQGRCWIYVQDLAEGNVAALKGDVKNQIINLAGREFVTINVILEELRRHFKDVKVRYAPQRPIDFKGMTVSIGKAREQLGWEPKTRFSDGLKKYLSSLDYLRPLTTPSS
jgi:UDP-glucose 4-epimerase